MSLTDSQKIHKKHLPCAALSHMKDPCLPEACILATKRKKKERKKETQSQRRRKPSK